MNRHDLPSPRWEGVGGKGTAPSLNPLQWRERDFTWDCAEGSINEARRYDYWGVAAWNSRSVSVWV